MASYPVPLPEVLEEELRYFFPELPAEPAKIESKDVRALGDFAIKLPLLAKREPQTRWTILHDRAKALSPDGEGIPEPDAPVTGDGIVRALQSMLVPARDTGSDARWLLDQLMQDPTVRPLIEQTSKLHELLQIRGARRLLLEQPELAALVLDDDALMQEFLLHSAAIRILDAEGFRRGFERYPPLLSIIGDDPALDRALADDPQAKERRKQLIATYARDEEPGWLDSLLQLVGIQKTPAAAGPALIPSATALKESFGLSPASDSNVVKDDPVPRVPLSHFNVILLELAYGDHLFDGHRLRALYDTIRDRDLAALCLSGGGIRSATFNLGVLQGLADHRLLTRFHYVSTVSGGGYIGSWLSSWIRRHAEGATGVAKDLSRAPIDPASPEVEPIQHLRKYTSYLTPAAGALSLDTWTLVATYLRNLLLNWTMLFPLLVAVLAVPRAIEAWAVTKLPTGWIGIAIVSSFAAMIGVAFARPASDITAKQSTVDGTALRKQRRLAVLWLVPLLATAVLFTVCWPTHRALLTGSLLIGWIGGASAFSAFVYAIRRALTNAPHSGLAVLKVLLGWKTFWKRALVESAAAAVAGGATGWLLATLFEGAFGQLRMHDAMGMALYVSFAPPLFLFCFFVEATLIVGLATYSTTDHDREWWARSAALLFVAGVVHAAGALCVLILPQFFIEFPRIWASAGGLSGVATWTLKRLLDRKQKDEAATQSGILSLALKAAALITLLLLIAAISLATTALLGRYLGHSAIWHLDLLLMTPFMVVLAVIGGGVLAAFIMSELLNVNVYSMHRLYRNRLVRAYLGACRRDRHPDAFTGFDPEDDLPMWQLRPEALRRSSFISLDAFILALPAAPALRTWFRQLDDELQACILQCAATSDPDEREELKTAILEGINTVMLSRDIAHDVPAPTGIPTLRMNREYLERCCLNGE
ncbi:MAG: rane protein of unknown function, contains domain, partial [Acidobacteria bacterium]|nr:rane protein of unknown function, contains domain [Acidobacteriota bacterium]